MFACGYSGVRVAAFFEKLAHFLAFGVDAVIDVALVKIWFWAVVVGENFVFYEAWLLSLIYERSDLTMGVMTLSK